jgi:NADPH-dependent stearoyl-CoA 9-desaturase
MAITDVAQYAHLSKTDMEALAAELDTIRGDVEENRGAQDATYIRRTIAFQRTLEAGARLLIAASRSRTGGSWGRRRWPSPRASRTWKSVTMWAMASGIG